MGSPYFSRYEQWPEPWQLALGEVQGEPVVVILTREADTWKPLSPVRLEVVNQRIARITDYLLCPWILAAAAAPDPASS